MRKKRNKRFLVFVIILTYIIGMRGFYQNYSNSFFDCLYATTSLFTMSLLASENQMNIYIEIARWLALFVSANVIILFFQSIYKKAHAHRLLKNDHLIVIHGNSPFIYKLHENIKDSTLMDQDDLWDSKYHLFSFQTNDEMLRYISDHLAHIPSSQTIYLLTDSLRRGNYENDHIIMCNLAENNARLYWKNYPLGFNENCIVIIGFGNYGRELLNQAILMNILQVKSHIEYHIFGNTSHYIDRHYGLKQCMSVGHIDPSQDSIVFYKHEWQKYPELLKRADRIILIDDNDETNLNIFNEIDKYFTFRRIDIKYLDPQIIHMLWKKNNVNIFGDNKTLLSREVVIDESTLKEAKKIHATYYKNYICQNQCDNNCLNCVSFCADWAHLNSFIRYSNIAQADHALNKRRILLHLKQDHSISLFQFYLALDQKTLSYLEEIEHIRWCRYYYLHNWTCGEEKNNEERTHPLLIDYHLLKETDQRKDRDPWEAAVTDYE